MSMAINREGSPLVITERKDGSRRVSLVCKDRSLAKQSELKGTMIEEIVKRFEQTGVLPSDGREGLFLDVSDVPDFQTAIERVRNAERFFMQFDAVTRARFENDAAVFLDFISDPQNEDEARSMGLLPALEPVKADAAAPPPVSPGGAAGAAAAP